MGNKFSVMYEDNEYVLEWFDNIDFETLRGCNQVCGFIFNEKGEICLIKSSDKQGWSLPGGQVEKYDKSFEEAFIRETIEEADLIVENIKRFGYFKITSLENKDSEKFTGRFIAFVKEIKDQTVDPAYGVVPKRVFIKTEEFDKYTKWGPNGIFQLNKAVNFKNKLINCNN